MSSSDNPFLNVLSETFGLSVEPQPAEPASATRHVDGGFKGADALLKGFGLTTAEKREGAEAVINTALAELGFDANVGSFRYGVLVIEATPVAARMLHFETARLLAELRECYPGEVDDLVVRTRRPSRR